MSNTIDESTVRRTEDEGVPLFKTSPNSDQYDIICAGFGPSALAIAIAMHERGFKGKKILFLEQQSEFGWHTGMLLPGTKMQISFMKDLATMRNPRSYFTFTNYLHHHGRLAHFINLSTFTPFREEFNHYMKWCASHFKDWVRYNQKVVRVTVGPLTSNNAVNVFQVITRNIESGELGHLFASHVIVATGGEVAIPKGLAQDHLGGRVIHSSQYLKAIPNILVNEAYPYRVAVVGGGQSAVEIVENLKSRYRQTHIRLFFRDTALRPSDDSPL
jgi:L-ornithine N5-monooxygenase